MKPTEAHLNLGTNEKMQIKFPDYDNFSIFHSFLHFMLVATLWILTVSCIKVVFDQNQIRLRKSNSCPKLFKFSRF